MKRNAQIQMGENVIILFIFFILLVFAIVFFTRIQAAKTQQKIDIDITGRGLQVAQRIAFLPELQCTKDNAEIFPGCYDLYSVSSLASLAENPANREYYHDILGFSRVTIKAVYPEEGETYLIYDRMKNDYTAIITTNVPVTLCDFVSSQSDKGFCSFGVLKIEVYN